VLGILSAHQIRKAGRRSASKAAAVALVAALAACAAPAPRWSAAQPSGSPLLGQAMTWRWRNRRVIRFCTPRRAWCSMMRGGAAQGGASPSDGPEMWHGAAADGPRGCGDDGFT